MFVRANGTWSQQAYLKAEDAVGFFFGNSVAVDGDRAVIGAYGHSITGVTEAGTATVFERSGSAWSLHSTLSADNAGSGDGFAASVAIDGDTMVVGAFDEDSAATGIDGNGSDNSAAGSGAVYVFTRDPLTGSWSQEAYMKASNTGSGDRLGYSVALFGHTICAGARLEDSNATGVDGDQGNNSLGGAGAAYVFTRLDGNWAQVAYVKASNTESSDEFASSVSLFGALIAVGAIGEDSYATGINGDEGDNGANDSGAAYVFVDSL